MILIIRLTGLPERGQRPAAHLRPSRTARTGMKTGFEGLTDRVLAGGRELARTGLGGVVT